MNRFKQVIRTLLVSVLSVCFLPGCGGGQVPANTVVMFYIGGQEETKMLDAVATAFNARGDEVQVRVVPIDGYDAVLDRYRYGEDLPDIVYIDDEYFKRFATGGHIAPLDELLEGSALDVGEMWATSVSRYRYNPDNNTSNPTDPLYCVPKESNPTVLYYNEGALKAAGITVISVDEENLPAFNAGETPDARGLYKKDFPGLTGVTVEAKGFMRDNPYYGAAWTIPESGETLVFNNRIPMSWDEIEDLAMIMTGSHNEKSPTTYGYYTEWWFNYGWSVGGDCVGDIDGAGKWEFTLGDDHPNYKVLENVTIDGTAYAPDGAGFTFVEYKDKNYLAAHPSEAASLVSQGKLEQFPSTLDAFTRFCGLSRGVHSSDPKGLAVALLAKDAPDYAAAMGKFNLGGELAMYVGYASDARTLKSSIDWDFAPLPVYKTYKNDGVTVDKIGNRAGHSKSTGFAISAKSQKKQLAVKFLEYIAGDPGQIAIAEGRYYLPNTERVAREYYLTGNETKNYGQIVTEAKFQEPGDWWYMPERAWIANWSQDLNQNADSVRNGGMTLSQYFAKVTDNTDRALKRFWK